MFREYWEYLVMTIAVYNCLWTPLTISFDWAIEQEDKNKTLFVVEKIFTGLYTFDILVQFLTSYINVTTGDEITKPSSIAARYIAGDFLIDVLSTIPFRTIYSGNQSFETFAAMCQLLKVFRILMDAVKTKPFRKLLSYLP